MSDAAVARPGRVAAVVVITAATAIVYELLIATLATYLSGDSALQYSLTIGVYLAAMGLGAWWARDPGERPWARLVGIELAVAAMGGLSGLLLYASHSLLQDGDLVVMVAWLLVLGSLVGMELPLLAELLRRHGGAAGVFGRTLAADYLGSLVGSLAFPLLLLPTLGCVNAALAAGAANLVAVALLIESAPPDERPGWRPLLLGASLLGTGALASAHLVSWFEHRLYQDEVVYAETTRYQRIVVTRFRDDLRLYSDRELQFSSRDEYRYHEGLVHPLLAAVHRPGDVLVIGGGDGLATRELLKDPRVTSVTLVDIDPAMTRLGRELPELVELNRGAFADPRVRIVNADGFRFLADNRTLFGAAVVDLPDPRTESLARLYSLEFYRLLRHALAADGALVVQASSPYYARASFWSVDATLRAAGFVTRPYRVDVPSFGEWGYVLAGPTLPDWSALHLGLPRRYLSDPLLAAAIVFDADTAAPPDPPVSTLESPQVWRLYREGMRYWRP